MYVWFGRLLQPLVSSLISVTLIRKNLVQHLSPTGIRVSLQNQTRVVVLDIFSSPKFACSTLIHFSHWHHSQMTEYFMSRCAYLTFNVLCVPNSFHEKAEWMFCSMKVTAIAWKRLKHPKRAPYICYDIIIVTDDTVESFPVLRNMKVVYTCTYSCVNGRE